ncbi:hypothetical protein [Streptomyces sp. Je 1-369]|uniref:hypothetical protein n=1 Tax=Streptomyces sp. Je 1-369 TaxID=2966192 RepID=UPI002285554C|nr:hypothetical protein [Streptomyces sp. Je 1-369]WAL96757.1 hypothetical protein NOO62_21085 [Streptomyces sp. Je 1-369]
MRTAVIISKAILTTLATWLTLTLLIALPALLPPRWEYYLISPASVALYLLAMLTAPPLVCWRFRNWIRTVPGDNRHPNA